jgi:hypothetical protein
VAARTKGFVCGRSLVEIAGPSPAGVMDVCFLCCQVEVSATGRSLIQSSPTECGVSVCDRGTSTMRKPWRLKKNMYNLNEIIVDYKCICI